MQSHLQLLHSPNINNNNLREKKMRIFNISLTGHNKIFNTEKCIQTQKEQRKFTRRMKRMSKSEK